MIFYKLSLKFKTKYKFSVNYVNKLGGKCLKEIFKILEEEQNKQILNDKQSVDQSGNGISYYMITKAFIKNKK